MTSLPKFSNGNCFKYEYKYNDKIKKYHVLYIFMDGVDKMAEMWLESRSDCTISANQLWRLRTIVWGHDPCETQQHQPYFIIRSGVVHDYKYKYTTKAHELGLSAFFFLIQAQENSSHTISDFQYFKNCLMR
jgi:hypothetical protein